MSTLYEKEKPIGYLISASLADGFIAKLEGEVALEKIKTGLFLCVCGKEYRFFCLVTDLQLQPTSPDILLHPPRSDEKLLRRIIKQHYMHAHVRLRPMIMLTQKSEEKLPVTTIASHFSPVFKTLPEEVSLIFGSEQKGKPYFSIGHIKGMEGEVCINMDAFAERSNGVFGKTGTGKTFITRLLLAGIVKHNKAVNLVFDMHSEYGLQARQEGEGNSFVKGLKALFPHKVAIFSLDPTSTRRRGIQPDVEVTLSTQDIRTEDITALAGELNLAPTAVEAAYLLAAQYKEKWLSVLLEQGGQLKECAEQIGAHPESLGALYRKLKRIESFSFLSKNGRPKESVIDLMLSYIDRGVHVILEFGTHSSVLAYLLVSGMITRRIHERYIEKTELFLASKRAEDEPKKLIITIEEAHKFLHPQLAKQTIFGIIAREMRKYYVSLLVVDQRPSSIDAEVLSQLGTRFVAALNDERDINAVLTGQLNGTDLKLVLAGLDQKQHLLAFGHSITMPVVVRTRTYDETFYASVTDKYQQQNFCANKEQDICEELFG